MKGILYNVVEDVVVAELGQEAWDRLVDRSGVDGAYTSLGSYPDSDLDALVAGLHEAAGLQPDAVLRLVGRRGFAALVHRHAELLGDLAGLRALLHALNSLIHPEVRKLYPGAEVPDFEVREPEGATGDVVLVYRSARRLCRLAEGLVLGAADHWGERVRVEHRCCVADGAPACELLVVWER